MARIEDLKVGTLVKHDHTDDTIYKVTRTVDSDAYSVPVDYVSGENKKYAKAPINLMPCYLTVVKSALPPVEPLFVGDSGWRA
jgi:hypothetical protein